MERVEKSTYRRVMEYLVAHPTPWRYIRETNLSDTVYKSEFTAYRYRDARPCNQGVRDVVEDANGNTVIASWDRDETASRIEGDVRALVDFANLIGEEYEPPCGWDTAYMPEEAEGGDGEDRRFSARNDEEFLRRLGYTPPRSSDEN